MTEIFYQFDTYWGPIKQLSNLLLMSFIIWLIIVLSIALTNRNKKRASVPKQFQPALLAIAVLGGMVGFAGGISRVGAVGDLIPAALTAIAGAMTYIFSFKRKNMLPISCFVLAFSVSLFFQYSFGAKLRNGTEYKAFNRIKCIEIFSNPKSLVNEEAREYLEEKFLKRCRRYVTLEKQ